MGAYFSVHLLGMAFLRLVQVANPDWRLLSWLSSVSTLVALALLLLWIGGPAVLRRCWFALAFFLTGLPWPTWLEVQFTNTVAPFSAQMATEFLWLCGVPAIDSGRTIHSTFGSVGVSDDCSGIRGF